jgi:parvulin-like peptidyl-prolyl isomerase
VTKKGFISEKAPSHLIALLLFISLFVSLPFTQGFPAEPESLYHKMFSSSVIREIRFTNELDPEETIREEIFIGKYLCKLAAESPVSENPSLLADIDYYQTQQLINDWLSFRVMQTPPKEEAVRALYEDKKEEYHQPELVTFQHIFLLVPEGNTTVENEKLERAQKAVKQLRRGRDFAELAKEFSDLPIAKQNDGIVGPVPTKKLNPTLQEAIKDLEIGKISDPIRTPYGWEVLSITNKREENTPTFEELKDTLAGEINGLELEEARKLLVEEVQEKYPVTINQPLIADKSIYQPEEVLLTIDTIDYTEKEILLSIDATHAHSNIKGSMERLNKGLNRFILTKQIQADAKNQGIMELPDIKTKQELIHNRLMAERYYKTLVQTAEPSEAELKLYYDQNDDKFKTPPQYKGKLYHWKIKSADSLSEGELNFQRKTIGDKIDEYIKQYDEDKITLDEMETLAEELESLDWVEEGPMGYGTDMAFSRTELDHFSSPFRNGSKISVAFVEGKKNGVPIPFDECQDRVKRLYNLIQNTKKKETLIQDALRTYAESN